jgi:lipid-binding SYLF domain-containing protein
MSRIPLHLSVIGVLFCCVFGGCSTAPKDESGRDELIVSADQTLNQFRASDPTLAGRMAEAHGYAVFPTVGKGGAGVGGAYGRGVVYELGRPIGYASLTQATVGFQLGGQAYSQLILFDRPAFDKFRQGNFGLSAEASAVAVRSGAAATATARDGVMVFIMGEKGLMYEAVVAGQKFKYEPR